MFFKQWNYTHYNTTQNNCFNINMSKGSLQNHWPLCVTVMLLKFCVFTQFPSMRQNQCLECLVLHNMPTAGESEEHRDCTANKTVRLLRVVSASRQYRCYRLFGLKKEREHRRNQKKKTENFNQGTWKCLKTFLALKFSGPQCQLYYQETALRNRPIQMLRKLRFKALWLLLK